MVRFGRYELEMIPLDVFHLPVGVWTLRIPQKRAKNGETETQNLLGDPPFEGHMKSFKGPYEALLPRRGS